MGTNAKKEWKTNRDCRRSFLISISGIYLFLIIFYSQYLIYMGPNSRAVKPVQVYMNNDPIWEENDVPSHPNAACQVPKLSIFTPEIMNISKSPNTDRYDCEKQMPLMFSTNGSTLLQFSDPRIHGFTNCCFESFKRGGSDKDAPIFSKKCTPIDSDATKIPESVELIAIKCKNITNGTQEQYVDMFGFPRAKNISAPPRNPYMPNVIVLGLDSISRMNFLRSMPKSAWYLKSRLDAISMLAYNKIGDNTYPNIVAALTSHNETALTSNCLPDGVKSSFYDDCPFIWKKFKNAGYQTVYGEDATWMGIFSYLKKGFKEPPTDHYLYTLTQQLDKKLGSIKLMNAKICYGPRLGFSVVLNYMKSIAQLMKSTSIPYFEFIWATSLFHDDGNFPYLADELLFKFLEWMNTSGQLENTVLIFMSDHGMRFGPLRNSKQGNLEERLPFLYFVLPSWMKAKFPVAIQNLESNAHRLSTPYDLYETLSDLLNLQRLETPTNSSLFTPRIIPRGISLFQEIPLFRTCKMAHVAYQWCTCTNKVRLDTKNTESRTVATALLRLINEDLKLAPECAQLQISEIKSVEQIVESPPEDEESVYDVSIKTKPGDGVFQAIILRDSARNWEFSDSLSRINLYANQSHCVDSKELKKSCYCLDLLETNSTSTS